MKNILLLLFYFCLLNLSTLLGQNTKFQKIDKYLKAYQAKIPIPGFSIAIVEDNKIVFSKGYGVQKQGTNTPMSPSNSLGIGSLGRGFTTVGIMQLVEKGKIDLDSPVTKYLPWFKTANKNFSDAITVRMCLSNTSAIPAQFEAVPSLNPDESLAKFVRSMEGYYVKRKPGLAYEFSDEGYSICGLIISELSGMTYADYIEKNIFAPLNMTKTTTKPSRFEELNVLYGHEMALSNCVPANKSAINGNFFPAGSEMKSSVNDFANFTAMLLNNGQFNGQQFLQSKSIEEIFKSNISFQGLGTMLGGNGIDIQCGLGWLEMIIEERPIFIQVGNTGTTAAIAGLSRERNQGVILIFNGDVNRLDRYVYPTLENTANNVIHILNGEATTDFAVMRFDDPYEDEDYVLPKAKWEKYLGKYHPSGQESPFFKDINIEVFVGESGQIELKAFNENNLKGHYILLFTNESRAALRNISHPREILFKLFPNGSIGGLFMFGTEFKKRDESIEAKFKSVTFNQDESKLIFSLPENKKATVGGKNFKATFPNQEAVELNISLVELNNQSFEQLINQRFDGKSIATKGNLLAKNLRGGIWQEQTVFTKEAGSLKQHLVMRYQDPVKHKQAVIELTNPYGKFNSELQEIVMYFQRTVKFE